MKLTCCLLLIASLLAQDSTQPGARVISAGDGWAMDGILTMRGKTIPAISSISGKPHADGLILECGRKGWLAYQCGNKECRIPVCSSKGANTYTVQRVDSAVNDRDTGGSPDSMLSSFFNRAPVGVETSGGRGAGKIADGVVLQDAIGVQWEPVLEPVIDGIHCFRVNSLPSTHPEYATLQLVWRHSEAASGIAKVPRLMPGLYVVAGMEIGPDGACVVTVGDTPGAWVLITSARDFARINGEWKRISSRLNHLATRPEVDTTVVATLRRIFLAYWADHLSTR
jgi:hypothetical protein